MEGKNSKEILDEDNKRREFFDKQGERLEFYDSLICQLGDIVKVKINSATSYDLRGNII